MNVATTQRRFKHQHCWTVLCATAGIRGLQLHQQIRLVVSKKPLQTNQRRMSDGRQDAIAYSRSWTRNLGLRWLHLWFCSGIV